jgi:hypothetical protein
VLSAVARWVARWTFIGQTKGFLFHFFIVIPTRLQLHYCSLYCHRKFPNVYNHRRQHSLAAQAAVSFFVIKLILDKEYQQRFRNRTI